MNRPAAEPAGGKRSVAPQTKAVRTARRPEPAKRRPDRDWRVIDDLPTPVPIAARELEVIERWLTAIGETEFGGSSAENTRAAPNRIGASEKPENLTATKGDSL